MTASTDRRRKASLRPRRAWLQAMGWGAGLLAVAVADPRAEPLLGLCPLDAMGGAWCPGCGLGHAVAFLVRGQVLASVRAHPLGVPAVLILLSHVARLVRHARRVDARRSVFKTSTSRPSCPTSSNTSPSWRATSSCTSPDS